MNAKRALDSFLGLCAAEIDRRAQLLAADDPVFAQGAAAFRAALDQAAVIERERTSVPVLAELARLENAPSPLGLAAQAAASEVPWAPTPRFDDNGETVALGFVDAVRDLGDLQCGLMLLAPGASYPEHTHPPQEIYLPIAGEGTWRYGGDSSYRPLQPDALVYNNPGDLHGATAGADPLLALYILWS